MLWSTPTMSLMFEQASTYLRLLLVLDCKKNIASHGAHFKHQNKIDPFVMLV